jgi:hypothetical protein
MATNTSRPHTTVSTRSPSYDLLIGQRISHVLLGNRHDLPLLLVKADPPLLAVGRPGAWIDVYNKAELQRGPIDLYCRDLNIRLAACHGDNNRDIVVGSIEGGAYIERIDLPVFAKTGVLSARGRLTLRSDRQ